MVVMKYITKNPRAKTTPRPAVHQPVPLVAGIWGVRCLPGPAWENAPQGATWGTVLNPSTVVHDWCAGTAGDHYVGGLCADLPPGAGTHRLGG